MCRIGWLLALIFLAGPAFAQQPQSPAGAGQSTLAVVGDRVFTTDEVDARRKADAPFDQAQGAQSLYEGRRAALESLVADYLIERAAAARGLTRFAFESAEILRRARPVTDAEIAAFYAANRDPGDVRPRSEVTPLLRELLEERHREAAYTELVTDLRKAEPVLQTFLDPPRHSLAIGVDDPIDGPDTAEVTIVEFADFECPFCRQLSQTLRQIRRRYGDRVRVVWKDLPLTKVHPRAFQAAEAARCAFEQGKFWEYHDRLFANQRALQTPALKAYARDVGLDGERFSACLESSRHGDVVRHAISEAVGLGVTATPTTFVSGRMISGAKPFAAFAAVIDEELRIAVSRVFLGAKPEH